MLNLYSFFHLNLAYSSIEEAQRAEVIEKCYWPLLRLAEKTGIPIGIELTGYSLEQILAIAPDWIQKLRELIAAGLVEFIGSGYAQIIGPLVPAKVTEANLRLGQHAYGQILSLKPQLALINEQAYSAGLLPLYKEAGFKVIIMEWNNPAANHPEWPAEWAFYPQVAWDGHDCELPVIWNHSIAFQKFQRYVFGEIQLSEHLEFLRHLKVKENAAFPLYGNDAEIFDFRPGRFHTEARLGNESEWRRIEKIFSAIRESGEFRFVLPGEALALTHPVYANNRIELQSPQQPVPVKKQNKYNVTRWAVTGINDLDINSVCWQFYEALVKANDSSDESWRELCYLWSSDFRTHITPKRWASYLRRLVSFKEKHQLADGCFSPAENEKQCAITPFAADKKTFGITEGRYLQIETEAMKVELDRDKGLALRRLWFGDFSGEHLLGTLPHGYFEDISYAADFYSGHFTFEMPGRPKITDLEKVQPKIEENSGWLEIRCDVKTNFLPFVKFIRINTRRPQIEWEYIFDWPVLPVGSMRFGHFTLNPKVILAGDLFFQTHNGGKQPEFFRLNHLPVAHGSAVSALVSASNALGLTEGEMIFGSKSHAVKLEVDKSAAALIGLVTYNYVSDSYLFRVSLSAREIDETNHLNKFPDLPFSKKIKFSISTI